MRTRIWFYWLLAQNLINESSGIWLAVEKQQQKDPERDSDIQPQSRNVWVEPSFKHKLAWLNPIAFSIYHVHYSQQCSIILGLYQSIYEN